MIKKAFLFITSTLIYCFIGLLVILLIISTIQKFRNVQSGILGYSQFTVLTGSMEPKFYAGDVIVTSSNIKELDIGDIITYKRGNANVTHRIVEVFDNGSELQYQTKGDNNNVVDNYLISENDIVGVYKFHIPSVGFFLQFVNTLVGKAIVITAIFGLLYLPKLLRK